MSAIHEKWPSMKDWMNTATAASRIAINRSREICSPSSNTPSAIEISGVMK